MNVAELGQGTLTHFGARLTALYDGQPYTNAELLAEGGRVGNALTAAGVAVGDRVALLLPNCPTTVACYDGIARVGAVSVPMLTALTPAEIAHICRVAEPRMLVTSHEFADKAAAALAGVESPPRLVVVGEPGPGGYAQLIEGQPSGCPIVERDADDLAGIAFTGGTTGAPQGVMLTHGNLLAETNMLAEVLDYSPDDVSLAVLPMTHLFGVAGVLSAMHYGYLSVVHRWFTPDAFLRAVQAHGVTTTFLVPTMLSLVLNHDDFASTDLSSLERVFVGGSPLPGGLADEWEARTGSQLLQGYGLTETTAGAVVEHPGEARRPGTCGRPLPRTEVAVVGADGARVAVGERGELAVRGPQVSPGYWRNPKLTAQRFVDGWLHTDDIAELDADGFVCVVERRADLIDCDGTEIVPRDVEEVLYQHPKVAEAAVIGGRLHGSPAETGQCVVAYVATRPGATLTEDDLVAFCRERLSAPEVPDELHFVAALPKSAVGKVLKQELGELVAHD
jgi:long-chain acyl-CoA synthetase